MPSTLTPAGASKPRIFGESILRTDGDLLLVAFASDGGLWSLEATGLLRHWTPAGQAIDARTVSDLETEWAFSRDARFALSGSKELTLWDVPSGRSLAAIEQDSWITALAAGTDPALAVTGHDDGVVRVWNLKSGLLVFTLVHHQMPISALAIHTDGATLAVASEDRSISLWDIASGKQLAVLVGHTDRIPALAWHPTDKILVSAGWDTTARVWDAVSAQPLILFNSHATQVTALAFSPDGRWLASADSALNVHVWDFAHRKVARVLTGPTVEVRSLAFSADSASLAATGDRLIHVWNVSTGESLASGDRRSKVKPTVDVSSDGTLLATNGDGSSCLIWDVASRQLRHTLMHPKQVHQVAFSPKGSLVAAACGDHVRIWDAVTGQVQRDLDGPDEPLSILAFSPDGTAVAASGYTSTAVWIWSVKTGEPLLIIPDPLQGCSPLALAFHPQGRIFAAVGVDWLATGGSSGAVSTWDLKDRTEIMTVGDGATAAAFDPVGARLAVSTLDQSIALYDARTLDLQRELLGHDAAVACLAFSPDGRTLASGGDDHTVRLWNDVGDEVGVIEVDSKVTALVFAPDGKSLFTAHANTTCAQYPLHP